MQLSTTLCILLVLFVYVSIADSPKNYYDILGVKKDATKAEIKSAYRKLAVKYHPDKFKGNEKAKEKAQAKFVDIVEAADTLSDDQKRREYDQARELGIHPGQQGLDPRSFFPNMNPNTDGKQNVRVHVHHMGSGEGSAPGFDFSQFADLFGSSGSSSEGFQHLFDSFPRQSGQGGFGSSRQTRQQPNTNKASKQGKSASDSVKRPHCPLSCKGSACSRKC